MSNHEHTHNHANGNKRTVWYFVVTMVIMAHAQTAIEFQAFSYVSTPGENKFRLLSCDSITQWKL